MGLFCYNDWSLLVGQYALLHVLIGRGLFATATGFFCYNDRFLFEQQWVSFATVIGFSE